MAKSKGGLCTVLTTSKQEEAEIAVNACQGWVDPCEFCDKRFNSWEEVSEELLEKIPTKPGIFEIALKNKGTTEVVLIVLEKTDIQKHAFVSIDRIKDQVADKKSKATKSSILFRWMIFKNPNDKDVLNLCAHWQNNGVLPKQTDAWPGTDILRNTDALVFSDKLQKWCYPKKDAYWKKSKAPPSKLVEVIEGCDWTKPCEICDVNFSKWMKLEDVVANDLAPDEPGLFMVSVCVGKDVEVVDIRYDPDGIKLNIKNALQNCHKSYGHVLKNKKFVHRDPTLKVRWTQFRDADSDNCCYLYAHWINSGSLPMMTYALPGDKVLDKNKNFVVRSVDKKWCYEIDAFKQMRITKHKNKKYIIDDLEEDMKYLNYSEQS
ncbi:hypothetical protein JTE90_027888 [Oedothorax gibbosus]|uniref:Uncharacterized protein n=1 Tax=Oedothorax gibbosus TaxID=931172 RepID=A0AAV6U7S4_9ARAC|nr:hypothetical protein JTE90_027888 [Oedothorax gibbosus]